MQQVEGLHSQMMEATQSRLVKGASWKRQRVIVILPAGDSIPAKVALSHWSLAFPPNNGVVRILAQGMEVGEAYSTTIEQVLADPNLSTWEYVLTIEHDNAPPWDGLLKLLERMEAHKELDAIGGLYFTKGPGGCAQIWGDPNAPISNFRPQLPSSGLVECCGTGMGFTLFRLDMFKDKNLRRPWFVTNKDNGVSTQDLHFWSDARMHGHRCAIDCDVRVGHYDQTGAFGIPDMMW